jgi:hypothetical protein
MILFDNSPFGRASEALYRLTLAPIGDGSKEQEQAYKELCENAVRRILECLR